MSLSHKNLTDLLFRVMLVKMSDLMGVVSTLHSVSGSINECTKFEYNISTWNTSQVYILLVPYNTLYVFAMLASANGRSCVMTEVKLSL